MNLLQKIFYYGEKMNKKGILFSICLLFSIILLNNVFLDNFSYGADLNNPNQVNKNFTNKANYTSKLFNTYKKGDSLKKYLIPTKNAPCNKKYIKDLSKKITENKNTTLSKAEAIFDWIKKNIKYSRYSNTKYGGEKTIKKHKGNCVDNSHALVSLLRASDIPSRYVNGRCQFTKGDLKGVTVAHVWVQVLVDNKWMVADGIYKGNKLGYVANWKVNSYKHYGIYPSI